MNRAGDVLQIATPFAWFGMVLAISELETPLKFRAPGITRALGLDGAGTPDSSHSRPREREIEGGPAYVTDHSPERTIACGGEPTGTRAPVKPCRVPARSPGAGEAGSRPGGRRPMPMRRPPTGCRFLETARRLAPPALRRGPTPVGFHTTFLVGHWPGNEGMPRRYGDYLPSDGFTTLNMTSTVGSFVLGASMLPFVWNVWKPYRFGRVVDVDDPRGHGMSLEATAARPTRTIDRPVRSRTETADRCRCTPAPAGR